MRVKCKICNQKGFFDESKVSEFWASGYLYVHINKCKDWFSLKNSIFICRKCIGLILDSLKMEQHRIEKLYEPQIKTKE